ncbi:MULTISPECIES: hypothetical protein [unclassified Bacillus (in: firmicutes)]|uniref:hypothetical protein n=1 Tax=unclassified Bacillus (in: firmicutes) TaxID=185979 RepID=UPI0015964C93|nr:MULTISPECIES: hypothetical protein [unclassified Bacillus (in: firmicutes)]
MQTVRTAIILAHLKFNRHLLARHATFEQDRQFRHFDAPSQKSGAEEQSLLSALPLTARKAIDDCTSEAIGSPFRLYCLQLHAIRDFFHHMRLFQ